MEARPVSVRPGAAPPVATPPSPVREADGSAGGPGGSIEDAGNGADRIGVAAVDRALGLLAAWQEGDTALPLHELARRTGLYKSTILRLMASLETAGCVRRRPDGRWVLGAQTLRWGTLYLRGLDRGGRVTAALTRLAAASGESASYWALERDHGVCVAAVTAGNAPGDPVLPGDRVPMNRLVSSEEPAAPGPAPAGAPVLAGSTESGAMVLGIPLLDVSGKRRGVLVLTGQEGRMREALETLEPLLRSGAEELSATLRAH